MANCVKSRIRLCRGDVMLFKGENNSTYDTVLVLKLSKVQKDTKERGIIHPRNTTIEQEMEEQLSSTTPASVCNVNGSYTVLHTAAASLFNSSNSS